MSEPDDGAVVMLLADVSHDITRLGIDGGHTMIHPPIPLLGLAAYLRGEFDECALRVEVLDVAVQGGLAGLEQALHAWRPRVVGLRSLSHTHEQFHAAAAVVKGWDPGALVIGGGMYANASPERELADPNVDAVCLAEGELVLRDLVRALLRGEGRAGLAGVRGIRYRAATGEALQNAPAPLFEELDRLPFPDYAEISLEPYTRRHAATSVLRPYGVIMTSRGCPYRCAFCHNLFGRQMRYRSPGNVAEELQLLHERQGIDDFMICDNIFNVDLGRAKEILRRICELGFAPRLYFPQGLRGDLWDDEFLDLLAAAGTVELVYSVESASPRLLELMRKELDLERVLSAIHATAARGIMVNAFFMIGFPTETSEELRQTVELIGALMPTIHFPFVHIVRAWDRGELYQLARREGFTERFMEAHAAMPFGFQEAITSPHNFLPEEELRRARLEVTVMFRDRARMARLLPVQRALFSEQELELKYACYFGTTSQAVRSFLAQFAPAGVPPASVPVR